MEPITKERLARYISLKKENENRLERLARLRSNAELPALQQGDGSKGSGSSMDRMARAVEKCMEYEAQIRPLIEANRREMAVIESAVAALSDPLERSVLQMRYLQPSADPETGRDSCRHTLWSDIANTIYGNPYERGVKMVMGVHRRAIEHLKSGRKVE
ncbi:hypothetical protein [uncultured Allofournierella sp.]|uniref:hypothetical protein n=1 Tax=uncultured Allofournierella sp. TaxID=1940258 RepID=UPI00375115CE